MHAHSAAHLDAWQHDHRFGLHRRKSAESRTKLVVVITLATMVAEIVAGLAFGSMALLADGWHMSSHALALGVSASAALGGVLAIYLGINMLPVGLFGSAMLGAGASIALLLAISRGGGPIGFILGGMVLSTLAGALTAFVISIAPNPFAASEIINWLMGALTDRLMADVWTALPFMALSMFC